MDQSRPEKIPKRKYGITAKSHIIFHLIIGLVLGYFFNIQWKDLLWMIPLSSLSMFWMLNAEKYYITSPSKTKNYKKHKKISAYFQSYCTINTWIMWIVVTIALCFFFRPGFIFALGYHGYMLLNYVVISFIGEKAERYGRDYKMVNPYDKNRKDLLPTLLFAAFLSVVLLLIKNYISQYSSFEEWAMPIVEGLFHKFQGN